MYVSLVVFYLGEAGVLSQIWPVIVLPMTVADLQWIVIPYEEVSLHEVFGREYQQYCAKVLRWI
jgi:protein-S-isoprenylcysteine O-methyltransferase Ste14